MPARFCAAVVVVSAVSLAAQGTPQRIGSGFGAGAYRPGGGVTDPAVLKEARPEYPSEAMRAGIQGAVELEAVVLPNGLVGDVRVTRTLGAVPGIDDEAIRTAKQWLFRPGLVNGQPVAVIVTMVFVFVPGSAGDRAAVARVVNPNQFFETGAYRQDAPGVTAPKLLLSTLNNAPVPVIVTLTVEFQLHRTRRCRIVGICRSKERSPSSSPTRSRRGLQERS